MPHGSLTPLGRRLRSVLAALRPVALDLDPSSCARPQLHLSASYTTNTLNRQSNPIRPLSHSHTLTSTNPTRSQQSVAARSEEPEQSPEQDHHVHFARTVSRTRRNKRTKVDRLGEELRRAWNSEILPAEPKRARHFNHRSRHGKRLFAENKKRHAREHIPSLEHDETQSLPKILATYLRYVDNQKYSFTPGSSASFELSPLDHDFLSRRGYDVTDLQSWADIVTEPDSYEAASMLHSRVLSRGPLSVPIPIFSYILRRPYITARALRVLIAHAWNLFAEPQVGHVSPDAIFIPFHRLARHAREVWPDALPSIAEFLVCFTLETRSSEFVSNSRYLQSVTFMLNKAMHLLSQPTSASPFKNIENQEAAIVRVLAGMVGHDSPLQINREGYRAVIRVQLASEKTDSEQRWASLKALSWPPWKEDQTSMDSELGPEHGISRAGQTLQKLKEAGYAYRAWETAAELYAGWDTDRTPTTQTRRHLPIKGEGDTPEGSLWVARIATTRTVQEAWACYLAFEETSSQIDQGVIFAITKKLHAEDLRQRSETIPKRERLEADIPIRKVYPGDSKEIEPLPPSTHLYTYTRTPPPSLQEFIAQLRSQKIQLSDDILAFLIREAYSVRDGMRYLQSAHVRYPAVRGLIALDATLDLEAIPSSLFEAYIALLSRLSNKRTPKSWDSQGAGPVMFAPSRVLADKHFNFEHSLIQAVWLLNERRTFSRRAWNTVLKALGQSRHYAKIHLTEVSRRDMDTADSPDLNWNAMLAYRLTLQILTLMTSLHVDLDTTGFIELCRCTENAGIATWTIVARDAELSASEPDKDHSTRKKPLAYKEARELLTKTKPHWRLEQYFKLLIGDPSYFSLHREPGTPLSFSKPPTAPGLPRLLTNPVPAAMHAYIRALGWCGANDSILDTVRWMVEYEPELAASAARTRNGVNVTRRIVVAIRVFLERSWLDTSQQDSQPSAPHDALSEEEAKWNAEPQSEVVAEKALFLRRLEDPATPEQTEEARALVESVERWGGWATDEEVEVYCRGGMRRFGGVK